MAVFFRKYRFLIFASILFIGLSLIGISRDIWFDESYSFYLTRGSFGKIAAMTALDVHPPLYYWLLKIWSFVFGSSVVAFRSFSIFAGLIAVIGMFLLFKCWFNEKAANFAIFFLVINPFFLFYATEARMYTLVFALMALSTLMLDLALKKSQKICWFIYFILITAGLYTHYFFGVVIVVQFIYLLKYQFNKKVLLIYPAVILAYLPWIPNLFSQMTEVSQSFWIEPVNFETVAQFFSWSLIYFEYIFSSPFYLVLVIITLILAVIVFLKNRKKLKNKNFEKLGSFVLFPPLILVIISAVYAPVYVPRYIIYSFALFPVLIALLAALDLKKTTSLALILMIITCSGFGIYNIYCNTNYRKNAVVSSISQINAIDDVSTPIIVSNISPNYYDAILNETERHRILIYHTEPFWGSITPIRDYGENYLEDFEKFKNENDSFWFLNSGEELKIEGFEAEDYVGENANVQAIKYVKNH